MHSEEITDDEVLDVIQVARLLKVGHNKVYALVREKGLPRIEGWDRKVRFRRESVLEWLATQEQSSAKRSAYGKTRKGHKT